MAASETIWRPVLGINLKTKMNSAVLKNQLFPTRECLYARIFADTKHLPPHFNRHNPACILVDTKHQYQ